MTGRGRGRPTVYIGCERGASGVGWEWEWEWKEAIDGVSSRFFRAGRPTRVRESSRPETRQQEVVERSLRCGALRVQIDVKS